MDPHTIVVAPKDPLLLGILPAARVRTTTRQECAVVILMDPFAYQMGYVSSLKTTLWCKEVALIRLGVRRTAPTLVASVCARPLWIIWMENNESLDSNLHICDSTAGDVPAPGDAGGLWYCGTQTQACNSSVRTFGIEQGFFAEFRNFSSSSSAAATPTKSTASVSSGGVTISVNSNTAAATGTRATEASCPSQTSSEITQPTQRLNTLSDGAIASIAIGGVCIALIFFGLGVFFSQRRKGRTNAAVQPNMGDNPLTQYWKTGRETIRRPSVQGPVRELDGDYPRVELS